MPMASIKNSLKGVMKSPEHITMVNDAFLTLTHRRAFLLAVLTALVLSFTGVFDHSVWTPDEPRVAGIGREMLISNDYVVPTLGGKPFLEKPPLYWWGMTVLYKIFGVSDGVARLTSALAGFCILLIVFDAGRRASDPLGGLLAVGVTATTAGFYRNFHRAIVDPWLALFIMLGYWAFTAYAFPRERVEGKEENPSSWYILVLYFAGGLAFLTKGPLGPVLLAGPIVGALLITKKWSFLRSRTHLPGIALFCALCLSWPIMVYLRGGWDLADGFVVDNIIGRFLPGKEGLAFGPHKKPFWYYLPSFPIQFIPWTLALPAVVVAFWRKRYPHTWNERSLIFWALIAPVGLILLSIPGTKRNLYLLPLLAPSAVVVGAWLSATVRSDRQSALDRSTGYGLFSFISFVVALALVLVPLLNFIGPRFAGLVQDGLEDSITWTMPSGFLFWGCYGILAVAGVVLIFSGIRLIKNEPEKIGLVTVVLALVVFVLGGSLQYQILDQFKNLHRMTEGLVASDAFSPRLIGYHFDETTTAIIPYDTGRMVSATAHTPEALMKVMDEVGSGNILALDRHLRKLPEETRRELTEIKRWFYDKRRVYVLLSFGKDADEI